MLIFVSDRFLLSSNLIEMEIEIEIGTETTSLLSIEISNYDLYSYGFDYIETRCLMCLNRDNGSRRITHRRIEPIIIKDIIAKDTI